MIERRIAPLKRFVRHPSDELARAIVDAAQSARREKAKCPSCSVGEPFRGGRAGIKDRATPLTRVWNNTQ